MNNGLRLNTILLLFYTVFLVRIQGVRDGRGPVGFRQTIAIDFEYCQYRFKIEDEMFRIGFQTTELDVDNQIFLFGVPRGLLIKRPKKTLRLVD